MVRRKEQRELDELIGGFKDLTIDYKEKYKQQYQDNLRRKFDEFMSRKKPISFEDDDPMDTSDLLDDDDYEIQVVRKKK